MKSHRIFSLGILVVALLLTATSVRAQFSYESSLSLSGGAYAASGFGTNHYVGVRYNYFFLGGRYFVEAALGFSSLRSRVLESVSNLRLFDTQRLYAYEFVGAYDASPSGYIPFITAGFAGINQGGQSRFAGVLGLGKRIPLPGFLGTNQLGLRYDIRDHIFEQRVNGGDSFIAHNIGFTLGMQLYF